MTFGETYIEVDASVVNGGIAPMAMISGNPEQVDGAAYVIVWIRWRYDDATGEGGYTGTGWYFDDPDNNIKVPYGPYNTEQEFKDYLTEVKPNDLNDVMSDWNAERKAAFLNKHIGVLQAHDCVYFTAGKQ